jgi:uroporphyrinogen-III synthase
MNILITRPREDAEKLSALIAACGYTPILFPLIEIVPRQNISVPNRAWQCLCLTSANGVAAIPDNLSRAIPVVAVGPQSAAAASAKGFTTVSYHGGDVDGLAAWISQNCSASQGPMLYLSGSVTSGDLEGQLITQGFDVTRIMAYDAVPTSAQKLEHILPTLDAVVLYSQRTAELWKTAIDTVGGIEKASTLTTLCLSKLVASRLPQSWNIRTAETPDEAAMLRLVEGLT